jgi:hypothetical protein
MGLGLNPEKLTNGEYKLKPLLPVESIILYTVVYLLGKQYSGEPRNKYNM